MKIGIDAREIRHPETGVGIYVVNLIAGLANTDSENTYYLFVEEGLKHEMALPDNFIFFAIKRSFSTKIQDQYGIVKGIKKLKIDIFHSPHHSVTPLLVNIPLIITIHDISWLDLPSKSVIFNTYYRILTTLSIKKASYIITVSQSTKKRISHFFPWAQSKTEPILIACDDIYKKKPTESVTHLVNEYKLDFPYVLYVGSFAKRKNLSLLINAMNIVSQTFPEVRLILSGKQSGKEDTVLNELNIQHKMEVLSKPKTKNEISLLYNRAKMLVFPSLYEGFGLPVLEAMACGCPVIASNTTSLPEIVGDAGILVDPNDASALARQIIKVLKDSNLAIKMSESGKVRSHKFNWSKVAAQTVQVYQKCKGIKV